MARRPSITSVSTHSQSREIKGTSEDAGHEQEVFHPEICRRSSRAMEQRDGSVFSRLADNARDMTVRKHNVHVKMLDS